MKQPPPQLIKQEGGGYQGAQQARPAALYEAAEPVSSELAVVYV